MRRGEQIAEGAGPAAEEKKCGDATNGDHVAVFRHEEHGELHGAVFGVIAAGELGFGFGKIEGSAVGFRVGRGQVDEEGDELAAAEKVPREQAVRGLGFYDFSEIEGAGAQDDANEGEAEGELVADHLRGRAEGAEERVFVVRRPAGECDAVDADGGHSEKHEEADIDVGDFEELDAAVCQVLRAEGHDGDRKQGAAESDERRERDRAACRRRWGSCLP